MSGDFPAFNGTELWGVLQDMDTLKKAIEIYGPVLDEIMQEHYGTKLLYMWPNPPSVLFCKDPVSSIDDLKGRKIRAYSPPLSDFIEGVGGIPVSISFGEVTTALQRGTLDCGVTGSLSANTSKWFDVVDYLYNLPGGITTWFSAVNVNSWNRLDPAIQEYLTEQFVQLESDLWANAIMQMEQGISCNSGVGECTIGIPGGMTIIESSAEDRARLAEISASVVVSRWAARCGEACVKTWNETIGGLVGITAVPAE
jgi:TRAP-type C4-dicarboxylate transport system substrate-binding protein